MDYLSIPVALRKGYFNTTDINASISNSLGLILSTRKGSLPFAPDFGCDLWDREYTDLFMTSKADVQASIRGAIAAGEPRIYNVSVSLITIRTSPNHPLGIAVKVVGNYKDEKDEKRFEEIFSIG